MSAPNCPKCGVPMTGGAPHGPWPVQYECHRCGTVVVPPRSSLAERVLHCLRESPLPNSTVELALVCAPEKPNGRLRVWQTLARLECRRRVRRLPPLPGGGPGRKNPLRWVLREGGAR